MVDLGWTLKGEANPCVIREADGTLTMTYQRISGPCYISKSTDNGVTWDHLKTQVSPGNAQLPRLAKREFDGRYVVTYQTGSTPCHMWVKTSLDPYDWPGPACAFDNVDNQQSRFPAHRARERNVSGCLRPGHHGFLRCMLPDGI